MEIKLGQWIQLEANRRGISKAMAWEHYYAGAYPELKLRRVNQRVVLVECTPTEKVKMLNPVYQRRTRWRRREVAAPICQAQKVWVDDAPTSIGHGSLAILEARLAAL